MVLVFWRSIEKRVTNSFPHNQIHLCIKDAKRFCQEKNNFYCSPQCFSVGHIVSQKHNIAYLFSNTVFIKTYVLNVFFSRYSIQQCMDIYGAQFNEENIQSGVTQTNTNYGGYGIAASKVSWHATRINWYLTHVSYFHLGFVHHKDTKIRFPVSLKKITVDVIVEQILNFIFCDHYASEDAVAKRLLRWTPGRGILAGSFPVLCFPQHLVNGRLTRKLNN